MRLSQWLIMAESFDRAMPLGDGALPSARRLRRHPVEGVRVFLAAYRTDPSKLHRFSRRRRSAAAIAPGRFCTV